ncbi:MAG: trimethylamine methyltransferase family protein [Armatimonadota bacterium]
MIDLFTESQVDQLAEATLSVLEQAGAMYQSDAILDALERAGAQVDRATQRARLPRPYLQEIIELQKQRQGTPRRQTRRRRPRAAGEPDLPGVHLHIAQFWFNHELGKRVAGNRADLIKLTRFGDALDPTQEVDQVLLMQEEPPAVEPLEGLLVLMENSSRPGITYPHFAGQFPYFEEIGQIWRGDPHAYLVGGVFLVSPLRMDRRACECLLARSQRGMHCGTSTEPVSGVSAPVTRAGTIVVGAAEILAGWAAVHALNPEATMSGNIESGVVDMRSGNVHFGAPEPLLQDLGCAELFRRRFGGHCGVAGSGNYTSGKYPGHQAAFERLFDSLTVEAYTGYRSAVGSGLLDSGKMFSPLQLLIDRELESVIQRFEQGVKVNAEEIALETVTAVGSGIGRSYLETEHTLTHYRKSLWFPRLLDRSVWQGDDAERDTDARLLQRAQAQFDEVMSRYLKPEVDEDRLAAVRAVVAKARRELLG